MTLEATLANAEPDVLAEAHAELERSHPPHYDEMSTDARRQRLADLASLVLDAVAHRDLARVGAYAERLAERRFNEGFDIAEVQAAFNAVELAMWRQVVATTPPPELAEAVGLLTTVFGFAKDTLARRYVSLASRRHVPSLDLSALFAGVE